MLDLPVFGRPRPVPTRPDPPAGGAGGEAPAPAPSAAPAAPAPRQVITVPGIYDMTADAYHADPCETPSLSAGMVNGLLIAPKLAQFASKRLNPDFEEDDGDGKFTIGSVSHTIYLEPERFDATVVVIDAENWRKKETKLARARARAEGKTPILAAHMDRVHAARAAFLADPFARRAFAGGKVEQSLFWKHPQHGFWCRARPDFLHDTGAHMCDLKMTGDADPNEFGRHAHNMNYHRRAAWYLWGAELALGVRPKHYWFINQQSGAPYLPAVTELDWPALELGQDENERACTLFAECLRKDAWPGFGKFGPPTAYVCSLPVYAFQKAERRIV